MKEEDDFSDLFVQKVERTLRDEGPHTSKELSEILYSDKEMYIVISGSITPVPEVVLDAWMEYSSRFSSDGTGRWHVNT